MIRPVSPRRVHNYDACLNTSHTHMVKYIFCLFHSSLSLSLPLSRFLCPPLSIHSGCMSVCFSLPASRSICGGVNRDAIPAVLHPHTGSMACWCTCLTRKKIGSKYCTYNPVGLLVTRLNILMLFPALMLPRLPHILYTIISHIHLWSPKQLKVSLACPCVAEWRWALDEEGQMGQSKHRWALLPTWPFK